MQHICHYTNFCVLKSIIENQCFWAFSTISQKDQEEVRYGIRYIAKNTRVPHHIRRFLEKYLKNNIWNNYIICFSFRRNEMRMWKNYTKDLKMGLSLVFNESKLLDSFKKKILSYKINQKSKLYTPEFLPCQYSDDEEFLSTYFDNKIDKWNKKYRTQSNIDIGIMFEELLGFAYSIKHKKFKYEGEKRIFLPPTVTCFLSEKEFERKKICRISLRCKSFFRCHSSNRHFANSITTMQESS